MPFPFEYRQSIRFDQRTLTKKVIPYNSEGIEFPDVWLSKNMVTKTLPLWETIDSFGI